MNVAAVCNAFAVPLSAHCAPMLHLHACASAARVRHLEYFFDHARIEQRLFDGFIEPKDGFLEPDCSRPGLGLELKRKDAEQFAM